VTDDVLPAQITRFRSLLADRLGWAFADADAPQLAQVLHGRADRLGLSRQSYLQQLGAGTAQDEVTALAEELSITETYFFRHAEQFHALAEAALPERIGARSGQRLNQLRMLSVGCSSGEEAYTMAIVGREALPDRTWTVSVLGLDANPEMLRRAADSRYSTWSMRETPDAVQQNWFRPSDGHFELDHRLHDSVHFRRYNVVDDDPVLWHTGQYDVIFCRNLLMYLTTGTARVLVRRMTRALVPGGYLFLGHTDTLGSQPDDLEPQHSHGTFYYRRPISSTSTAPPASASVLPPPAAAPTTSAPERPDRSPADHRSRDTPDGGRTTPLRNRAMTLLRDERFADALVVIEAGDTGTEGSTRPDPGGLLLHGVLLMLAGRGDEAETLVRRLVDSDGLYADGHHLLGVCLEGGGAVEVAVVHYRLAAYLDPEFAMPRLRLGLLARRRGDHDHAGEELDRALSLLMQEQEERIVLFGGGFGRISLVALCRSELDAAGAPR
jgi:chemotaxis protein methyltransferase CheR